MRLILNLLTSVLSIYSLLIFIRIIISWFGSTAFGSIDSSKPASFLSRITDPYLDWWRRTLNLRFGVLDLSPIAAIAALSIVRSVVFRLSAAGMITIGNVLAIILVSLWSVAGFVLGFFVIVFILRIIAFVTNRDIYSPFWRTIDTITQPVLYKLNRIFFRNKISNFLKSLIFSTLAFAALWAGGGFLIPVIAAMLTRLPF